jgi:transposase
VLGAIDHAQVYFARDPVDLRKQIDGLSLIVQEHFELDPFSPALFAFCNRQHDKVKVLYWHINGFCLLYKRMEKGRFQWPVFDDTVLAYSSRDLMWLLEGFSLRDLPPTKALKFAAI